MAYGRAGRSLTRRPARRGKGSGAGGPRLRPPGL